MAKSNNKRKRKNGTFVKSDRVKRMRLQASYDLQDLMVCSVVDIEELEGKQKFIPKTLIFNRKLNTPVDITLKQEVALKKERWKWNIHSGIVCRKQNGEIYFDREENIFTHSEVLLKEMNSYIADTLTDHFQLCNPMHRLTMFWVATPYDMGDVPLKAVLSPLWKYNVLGNMLTQYEEEYPDVKVVHYVTPKLDDYVNWFVTQDKYLKRLKEQVSVTFKFEVSGVKMQKGELVEFRERIQELNLIADFNPLATPKGFSQKEWTFTNTGYEQSKFMLLAEKTPKCLSIVVQLKYADGEFNEVSLTNGVYSE